MLVLVWCWSSAGLIMVLLMRALDWMLGRMYDQQRQRIMIWFKAWPKFSGCPSKLSNIATSCREA